MAASLQFIKNSAVAYPACTLQFNGKQCNKKVTDNGGGEGPNRWCASLLLLDTPFRDPCIAFRFTALLPHLDGVALCSYHSPTICTQVFLPIAWESWSSLQPVFPWGAV